ncbi:MAG: response regulator [Nitrospirae bacterium]|nr:response regulator [Nitrospirota bacterium]MCL5421675.1 response regulator [Nitrospirota bacterium]
MKEYKLRIINSLTFRVIIPIVATVLLGGYLLYFIVLRSMSDLVNIHIRGNLETLSTSVYNICEQNLNELLRSGTAGDEGRVRIKKGITLGKIEDFMRANNLLGAITEGEGRVIFSTEKLPFMLTEIMDSKRNFSAFKRDGKGYHVSLTRFDPWQWRIILIKDDSAFTPVIYRTNLAYGATGLVFLISALLLFYYIDRIIRLPVSRIVNSLKKGEKPQYRGISEFEFLSDTLRSAIELHERENRMLNNIYHIATSRRGEEFLDEVVMAISRMFDLNSLIARVGPEGESAHVVAMYYGGELKKDINISLKGTVCEGVVTKKQLVVFEKDAYKQFPSSNFLLPIKADSYIGLAVFNRKGDVVGIVNAFGKEREFTESDIKVFQTIGQMVATEFERIDEDVEKEKVREQLFQAQKLEAVGTLAGGIAHDFNNMLQGILGYASLLKMKISEDDPIQRPLSVIESSAEKAGELTKQLLGFARKGKYVVEPLNLNALVDDVFKIITRTFDRAIEITTTLKDDLWTIDGDRSQLEHVILNLCLNARDAMPSGGRLHIETMNVELRKEEIQHPWLRPGRYAALRVADTGMGMNEEVKKHIFEPFFTTKEKGKGTGMGLAMVYGVVKNHDGFITVDSEIGKGSSLTIYLPAVEKEARKEEVEERSLPHGKGTILVVDDEEFIRIFARETLEKLGYQVMEASNGLEAVEIYSARKKEIDLVILDLIMPKMGGEETFRNLKTIDPEVKVLISSGYGIGEQTKEMMSDTGIRGFVQKPYTVAEIAEMTKSALSAV